MTDKEQRHAQALIELLEEFKNACTRQGIERTGRFIGDDQRRAMQDRHGDEHSLRLSHADLARIAPPESFLGGEMNFLQDARGDFVKTSLSAWGRVRKPGLFELGLDAQARVESGHGALQDERHPAAAQASQFAFRAAFEVLPFEDNTALAPTAAESFQLQQGAGEGALTGAAFAD